MSYLRLIAPGSILLSILLAAGFLSSPGCSKGQVKLSETEQQIQKIDAFLSGLQESYAKKDLVILKSYFSTSFQDRYPELFHAIEKTFRSTDQLQMDLTVDVIHKDGEKIKVLLHWDVNAKSTKGTLQNRGNTALQLLEGKTLQVVALEGDNPFLLGEDLTGR